MVPFGWNEEQGQEHWELLGLSRPFGNGMVGMRQLFLAWAGPGLVPLVVQ
jgi:hypothetical protein